MTGAAWELPDPPRDWPPALRLLLGPDAVGLCAAALGPTAGRVARVRPTGASVRPGGSATVRYAVEVVQVDGRTTREAFAATAGARAPTGAAVVDAHADGVAVRVGLWRWPADPALPALEWATRAAAVAGRLAAHGLPRGRLRLRLRSYRPGRRAVVEAATDDGSLFLKVVRPSVVPRLVERHALLAGSVPVPPVLAATDDGVVVLPALPGTPLRTLIAGDGTGLPGSTAIDDLLDALPATAASITPAGRHRPGDALARVPDHAAVLGLVAPELRPRLTALAGVLAGADPGEHPDVPVHGDFYESQLLVDDGVVVGLLDVDTVGRGARIDDWATLLGHVALLARILPEPATARRYHDELVQAALHRWPAPQLRPRVAAVLVGLATGPFRVLQPDWPARTAARLALAERWAAAG